MKKNYYLFGGGVMADRIFHQLQDKPFELIGVLDWYNKENRKINSFYDFEIKNLDDVVRAGLENDAIIIVAVGTMDVYKLVQKMIQIYPQLEDVLVVPNPYTTLRFWAITEGYAKEEKKELSESEWNELRALFHDELSLRIFDFLKNSDAYSSLSDPYQLIPYKSIKDIYYYEEDYWNSLRFGKGKYSEATIFDCGAYIGDSVEQIVNDVPEENVYYYAFEPGEINYNEMLHNRQLHEICTGFFPMKYGVGEKNEVMYLELANEHELDGGHVISEQGEQNCEKIEICALDMLDVDVKGQLYIKMDIEGSELAALNGARKIIQEKRPYLAICVYHRKNDLIDIPHYIKSITDDYEYYLRGGFHTIFWAVPKENK